MNLPVHNILKCEHGTYEYTKLMYAWPLSNTSSPNSVASRWGQQPSRRSFHSTLVSTTSSNTTHLAMFTNLVPIQPHQLIICNFTNLIRDKNLQKSSPSHFRKHLVCIINSALLNSNQHSSILYCGAATKTSNQR